MSDYSRIDVTTVTWQHVDGAKERAERLRNEWQECQRLAEYHTSLDSRRPTEEGKLTFVRPVYGSDGGCGDLVGADYRELPLDNLLQKINGLVASHDELREQITILEQRKEKITGRLNDLAMQAKSAGPNTAATVLLILGGTLGTFIIGFFTCLFSTFFLSFLNALSMFLGVLVLALARSCSRSGTNPCGQDARVRGCASGQLTLRDGCGILRPRSRQP